MKLLVFGKNGQVAQELQGVGDVLALGRDQADLADPDSCIAAIEEFTPGAVINAAAYTAVDAAEAEEDLALLVNGNAPSAMARVCAQKNIPLVHVSTDYVFDGQGNAPWRPTDQVAPLNAYGRTKLAGEEGVREAGGPHAILRTSWVFSAHGSNFLKTMLKLGKTRDKLNVVGDQIGGPTPARAIAEACYTIARQLADDPGKSGTYHFSGAPDTSWAGFAREIMAGADLDCVVSDIPTSEYPTPAPRPLNSRLDCSATQDTFGLARPEWRNAVRQILARLANEQ